MYFASTRCFENHPNEILSHWSEKASKCRLFGPDKLQNHSNEGKERKKKERERRKKGGEEKKAMVALVFIMATLEKVFGREKTVRRKRSIWR